MRAHVPKLPTPRPGCQKAKKREQTEHSRMRRSQVQPAGLACFAVLTVQCDEKVRAEREQFPGNKKMQSIERSQDNPKAEHQRIPPKPPCEHRTRVCFLVPVLARIDCPRPAD